MTRRSGSETRQRTKQVSVRLTPAEAACLTHMSGEAGTSPGALLRDLFEASLPDDSLAMALGDLGSAEQRLAEVDALVRANRGSVSKAKRKFVAAVEAALATQPPPAPRGPEATS